MKWLEEEKGEGGRERETYSRSEETLYLVVSKVKYYSDFIFISIRVRFEAVTVLLIQQYDLSLD